MAEKRWVVGVRVFGALNIVAGMMGISLMILDRSEMVVFGALFLLIVGIGLLGFKEWARRFEIWLTIIGFFIMPLVVLLLSRNLIITFRYMFQSKHLPLAISTILIVYFFTRPKVKKLFK